ncbi:MAG: hypothetical protein Q8T11_04075 [Elusimicrobiota bacterium]|nr:hypothetical protein [Elusimicrobiota bacterium]
MKLSLEQRGSAALAGAIALIYAPALRSPVIYDDASHVRDNPAFRLPFGEFLSGLFSRDYFSFANERTYQPLVTLFHYATHDQPLLYRAFGLSLHFLNAVLLYRVALALNAGRRPAIFAAILFAVFPASTELLNFSSFKGHLFAATCILAVLLSVIRYCADTKKTTLPLNLFIFLILGLFSKESALVAVPLSLTYIALFARPDLPRLRRLAAPVALICAAYFVFRFAVLSPPRAFPRTFDYSALESFAFYLRTLAVPYPLCLERTMPLGPWWIVWLALFAGLAVLLRRSKESLFALAWIPVALLPFLHLIPFSNVSPVADRYLYLPAAGLCLLLARLPVPVPVLVCLAVLWSGISVSRNMTYRSTRALFEQTASCAPRNARAQFLLGMICFQEKDYPAARAAYQRVLALTESSGARAALADIERAEKAAR